MRVPKQSPWGHVDSYRIISDDIIDISTASHGGFALSVNAWKKICADFPDIDTIIGTRQGKTTHFLEEDCEWCFMVISFPENFSEETYEAAKKTMKNWYPHQYMQFFNETLSPEESYVLGKEDFELRNKNNLVAIAAWRIEDSVFVIAKKGGYAGPSDEEFAFLVDPEKYRNRSNFGYVIDHTDRCIPNVEKARHCIMQTTEITADELMCKCTADQTQDTGPSM